MILACGLLPAMTSGCKPPRRGWGRIAILESRLGPTSWHVVVAEGGQGAELFVDGSPRPATCRRGGGLTRCWVGGLSRGYHRLEVRVPGKGSARRSGLTNRRPLSDEVIYQVLLDRFHDGDLANNLRVNRADRSARHGGDLKGLRRRLSRIRSLGATAVLLSPIWEPRRRQRAGSLGAVYLGQRPRDALAVDPALGSPYELMRLFRAARKQGLRLLLDLPRPPGFDVARYMRLVQVWLARTFADGCRIGPVRPGEEADWATASARLAEAHSPLWLIHHTVSRMAELRRRLGRIPRGARLIEERATARWLLAWLGCPSRVEALPRLTRSNGPVARVLSDHAQPVLLRRCGKGDVGEERADLALTLHLLLAEIPRVYYADEIPADEARAGGRHPDVDWKTLRRSTRRRLIRRVLGVRRGVSALRLGSVKVVREGELLAVGREHGSCRVVVVANRGARKQTWRIPLARLGLNQMAEELVDRLSGRGFSLEGGQLTIELGPRRVAVLVPVGRACRG